MTDIGSTDCMERIDNTPYYSTGSSIGSAVRSVEIEVEPQVLEYATQEAEQLPSRRRREAGGIRWPRKSHMTSGYQLVANPF